LLINSPFNEKKKSVLPLKDVLLSWRIPQEDMICYLLPNQYTDINNNKKNFLEISGTNWTLLAPLE